VRSRPWRCAWLEPGPRPRPSRASAPSYTAAYAAELGPLAVNPLGRVTWRPPRSSCSAGPRSAASPAEVQAILGEVTQIRLGLTAFFGCLAPAELRAHRRWAAGLGCARRPGQRKPLRLDLAPGPHRGHPGPGRHPAGAPGTAALMSSSTEATLPCSRSLTCILLSPIALASMRTYQPRGEGLNSHPPTNSTRDHSSTGNGDGNVTWSWHNTKVQSRSCTTGIGPNDVQTFCLCH
jgi:hypothetical protein